MVEKAREAARAVVDSAMLTLAARAVTLIGIPMLMAWLAWVSSALLDVQHRLAVLEAARVQGRTEIIQRIERLEQSDMRDRETLSGLQQRLAGVDATAQAILREIEAMRREIVLSRPR